MFRQLNESSEAFLLFERWAQGKLVESPVINAETCWRVLPCADLSSDLRIYFRLINDFVEFKVGLRVSVPCPRLVQCLLDPVHRSKWDPNLTGCEDGAMDFAFDLSGTTVPLHLLYQLVQQWPNRLLITFHSSEKDPAKRQFISKYVLLPGEHPLPSTPKASVERTKLFPDLEESTPPLLSESSALEASDHHTLLKYYAVVSRSLARLYLPDMLGESTRLQKLFLAFKRYAEEAAPCQLRSPCSSFIGAVERKSLTPTAVKRAKRTLYLTTAMDDQVLDSRLVRRMFQ